MQNRKWKYGVHCEAEILNRKTGKLVPCFEKAVLTIHTSNGIILRYCKRHAARVKDPAYVSGIKHIIEDLR